MPALLEAAANACGDRPAVVAPSGEVQSHGALWRSVARGAEQIATGGWRRLAVLRPPDGDAIAWWMAALCQGAAVTFLDHRTPAEVLRQQLAVFEPGVVIGPGGPEAVASRAEPTGDIVVFSSGTSGAPKAVVHTQASLAAALRVTALLRYESLGLAADPDDGRTLADLVLGPGPQDLVFSNGMPLSSVSGLTVLLQSLAMGASSVVADGFAPGPFLDLVDRFRVTNLALSPHMAQAMVRTQRRAPRRLGCILATGLGGGPAPPGLGADVEAHLGGLAAVGYGTTETAGPVLMARYGDPPAHRWRTVGRPAPGVQVAIAEPDRAGVGRLMVRHPALCAGYLQADGTVRGARVDGDGWYDTGDRARVGEAGTYTVHGRTSELIVRGGRNVDPAAIEQVLELQPGVGRAAVVGVPSPVAGEEDIHAVLVADGSPPDLRDVRRACLARLGPALTPQRFSFADELPLTADLSVRRSHARALLGHALAAGDGA